MSGRQNIVTELKKLLELFYGTEVKVVYDYLPDTFDGKSPIIALYASGSRRIGAGSRFDKIHRIYIYLAAVYAVENVPTLTEQVAQHTINRLSDRLDQFVEEHRFHDGYWNLLSFLEEFSEVTPLNMGSLPYMVEIVPVTVTEY